MRRSKKGTEDGTRTKDPTMDDPVSSRLTPSPVVDDKRGQVGSQDWVRRPECREQRVSKENWGSVQSLPDKNNVVSRKDPVDSEHLLKDGSKDFVSSHPRTAMFLLSSELTLVGNRGRIPTSCSVTPLTPLRGPFTEVRCRVRPLS